MRSWSLIVVLLGCARELTVPSIAQEAPRFLGEYSGLYEAFDDQITGETGTLIVQFGDKGLVTPYDIEDGEPVLEIFANVSTLHPEPDGSYTFTATPAVDLDISEIYGPGAHCDDAVASPATLDEFFSYQASCDTDCTVPCWLTSPLAIADGLAPGDGVRGDCQADGRTCSFPQGNIGGRVSPAGFELYFPHLLLLPPGRRHFPCDDPNAWERCYRYRKVCSFDPRLAGVYRVALTYDASRSDVAGEDRELEVAVAADHSLAATAVYDGECAFFGKLDPFSLELDLEASDLICTKTGSIQGRLEESGDLVELRGTWSEGDAGERVVYSMSGIRATGSTPGLTCTGRGRCPDPVVECPAGVLPASTSQLVLDSAMTDNACVTTSCTRITSPDGLCPDTVFPCPGSVPANGPQGPVLLMHGRVEMRCRDRSDACGLTERCLDVICSATDPMTEGMLVDARCAAGDAPLIMSFDFFGQVTTVCPPGTPYCSELAPVCPLSELRLVRSSIEPVQTEPCFQEACWQNVTASMLCGGSSLAQTCPPGEAATATADALNNCVVIDCAPKPMPLLGVPCHALPTAQIPPHDPALGVDVADVFGCPLWRPHAP